MKFNELHEEDVRWAALISLFVSYLFAVILLFANLQLSGWETAGALLIIVAWPVLLALIILRWNIH